MNESRRFISEFRRVLLWAAVAALYLTIMDWLAIGIPYKALLTIHFLVLFLIRSHFTFWWGLMIGTILTGLIPSIAVIAQAVELDFEEPWHYFLVFLWLLGVGFFNFTCLHIVGSAIIWTDNLIERKMTRRD